ncbi:MAG: ribosomal-protein-alanine N-acetyltransferase [Ulvibacter sp.]|jgi:ribosomal-protein-alanine N-acetyltransferase
MYKSDTFWITEFELSDADKLCGLMTSNSERFQEYFPTTLSQNLTVSDSKAYILRKEVEIKNNLEFTFAIKDSASKNMAGIIILKDLDLTKKVGEIAYAMDRSFGGKGWMSLVVKELSKYAFRELELKTLKIITHSTNLGSCKIALKNGYVWQRTLKNEHTPVNGSPIDMELYELNAES